MQTVFISAGHSNTASGATANGATEAALAVELRNAVVGHLILAGYDVAKKYYHKRDAYYRGQFCGLPSGVLYDN